MMNDDNDAHENDNDKKKEKDLVFTYPPPLEQTNIMMKTTTRKMKTWYSPTPLSLNEGGTTVGTPPVQGQAHSQLLQPQPHSHPKLIF